MDSVLNDLGGDEEVEEVEKDKYLTFSIDEELYGIDIKYVIEIVGTLNITIIHDYPDFAKGVINLRGEIIPIIDLRTAFKKPEVEFTAKTCFIIITIHDNKYGFIVDFVSEVTDFGENSVIDMPTISDNYVNKFTIGVAKSGDDIIAILDPAKVIN